MEKPSKYTIQITILPQGPEWEGAKLRVKLGDIERASIVKPDYPAEIRATVRMLEDSLGLDLEDFPA